MASDTDKPGCQDATWTPSLSCATWNDAHLAAAAMHRGGVLIRTPSPPPPGAPVHLTLRFPDGSDVVLVGDVLELMGDHGAVVRFRVATPILTQLETRAFSEMRATLLGPGRPLARGSHVYEAVPQPLPDEDPSSGTTYAIHRKKKTLPPPR